MNQFKIQNKNYIPLWVEFLSVAWFIARSPTTNQMSLPNSCL
ncbi:hypothetical protein [Nostoc parmelioides]|nr:hypothetical protein [Nostoc parmelioides]